MKLVYVGDCHATPDSLDEMLALIELVKKTIEEHEADGVVFLGDQFHTHATVNVYVLTFWHQVFTELSRLTHVFALVGNHDIPGKADADGAHAMTAFKGIDNVLIVDKPIAVKGVVFAPYFHDKTTFETYAWPKGKTLVCHQTFMGAQYENGFYDKDGALQELLPFESIISGHIHKQARFGKVHYLGSPRWRVVDDANEEKYIWIIEHDDTGAIVSEEKVYTGKACMPMFSYTWKEDEEKPTMLNYGNITIDLVGSETWIKEREALSNSQTLNGGRIRIRRFYVTKSAPKVRESEGLANSFKKYVTAFPFPNNSDPEAVWGQITPQVSWLTNG